MKQTDRCSPCDYWEAIQRCLDPLAQAIEGVPVDTPGKIAREQLDKMLLERAKTVHRIYSPGYSVEALVAMVKRRAQIEAEDKLNSTETVTLSDYYGACCCEYVTDPENDDNVKVHGAADDIPRDADLVYFDGEEVHVL